MTVKYSVYTTNQTNWVVVFSLEEAWFYYVSNYLLEKERKGPT